MLALEPRYDGLVERSRGRDGAGEPDGTVLDDDMADETKQSRPAGSAQMLEMRV